MTATLPKLRPDLATSQQDTESGPALVIKDPTTGRFFRLRDAERFIAEQLDGATPLDEIRRKTETHFDGSLPPEALTAFVGTLEKAGLLERPGDARVRTETGGASVARRAKRIRGNLLYLRIALFDPDRLLTSLERRLRFIFERKAIAISAALIVIGALITIANAGSVAQDVARLYSLRSVPLFLVVLLVIGAIHELGHGLTCKHYGGEIHEVGFMLIYFTPAFYCNVSDAWLFPERSKRLKVGIAGPYFELTLWALATIAWRVTEVDTWINSVSLVVMTISGIKSLLNLNPLIKLDGYYLLSDYLDIPNLRARSLRFIGARIKRLVSGGPDLTSGITPRERRIFFIYGFVATISSLVLLLVVSVKAGGYLFANHQALALLVFTGLVGLKSGRRFRRLFGSSLGTGADPDEDGGVIAASTNGKGPPPPPTNRKLDRRRRKQVWGGALAALLLLAFVGHRQLRIGGPFDVLPEGNADVRPAVDGIVDEVLVDEGTLVKAGDVIARLSDRDLREQLVRTEAQVNGVQANISKLQGAASFARSKLARAKMMFQKQLLSAQDYETEQQGATSTMKDIDASRAELGGLQSQQRFLEQKLQLLNVVSPVTGVVATPSRELHALRGQLVGKGALIAKVYEVETVTAQITVPEKEIADVQVGQPVRLRSRAYPNIEFRGTVTAIGTAAQGSSSVAAQAAVSGPPAPRAFTVTTQIDNHTMLLKPGMTGQAKVYCGDRRIIDLIGRRLARTFKVEFWSWT